MNVHRTTGKEKSQRAVVLMFLYRRSITLSSPFRCSSVTCRAGAFSPLCFPTDFRNLLSPFADMPFGRFKYLLHSFYCAAFERVCPNFGRFRLKLHSLSLLSCAAVHSHKFLTSHNNPHYLSRCRVAARNAFLCACEQFNFSGLSCEVPFPVPRLYQNGIIVGILPCN